jgi:hypothetical protein
MVRFTTLGLFLNVFLFVHCHLYFNSILHTFHTIFFRPQRNLGDFLNVRLLFLPRQTNFRSSGPLGGGPRYLAGTPEPSHGDYLMFDLLDTV